MNFKYRAKASDGEIIEGWIEADEQKQALESLRNRGMIVINLNAQAGLSTSTSKKKKGGGNAESLAQTAKKLEEVTGGWRRPTRRR